ncbi:MAG: DUF2203 family protein [Gemmataceae bacterium]|nr:DUF2203 family protein [Gemmataceae bacterium]
MKRRQEKLDRTRVLRLWTLNETTKAAPYLHSVIGSLREHWLEVLAAQRRLDRAPDQPASVKRTQIIEHQAREDERQRAQADFNDALDELNKIDIFLLDPVQGLALIPFRKGDDLAWFVFNHFSAEGTIGWRCHDDPIEKCRTLSALEKPVGKLNV